MKLQESKARDTNIISNFTENSLVVNSSIKIKTSCFISADKIDTSIQLKKLTDFNEAVLEKIISQNPDVLIVGTGKNHLWLDKEWSKQLLQKGIGFETMTNSSAMRTYNLLASEGRKVLLLLIYS